jgi:hypothetical protein
MVPCRRAGANATRPRSVSYFPAQILSADVQNPTGKPSNFFAYDFKGRIARFEFDEVWTTIDIDWSIFPLTDANRSAPAGLQKTVMRLSTIGPRYRIDWKTKQGFGNNLILVVGQHVSGCGIAHLFMALAKI